MKTSVLDKSFNIFLVTSYFYVYAALVIDNIGFGVHYTVDISNQPVAFIGSK